MCSSTRGPAMPPSLVTWPTRNTAVPVSLAKRTSRAADSRTWRHRARRRGQQLGPDRLDRIDDQHARLASSMRLLEDALDAGFGQRLQRRPAARPRRCARDATCASDSSPVTYSAGARAAQRAPSICSSSVDLPMPGSPPISTTEPWTSPPPSTRSSSRCRSACAARSPRTPATVAAARLWFLRPGPPLRHPCVRLRPILVRLVCRPRRTSGRGPAIAGFRCRTGRRQTFRWFSPWCSVRAR